MRRSARGLLLGVVVTAMLASSSTPPALAVPSAAPRPDRPAGAPDDRGRRSVEVRTAPDDRLAASSTEVSAMAATSPYADLEPGWPADVYVGAGTFQGGPVQHALVGSIDDDPRLEVLAGGLAAGPLHAYHSDGTPVSGWPAVGGIWSAYPALGDLSPSSGRGLDVVAAWWNTQEGGAPVSAFRGDGERLPGWPQRPTSQTFAPPVVTDLDGDGLDEVITDDGGSGLTVLDRTGQPVPWWAMRGLFFRAVSPAVADLDGDGRKEVVVAGQSGDKMGVAVHDWRGEVLPGWPLYLGSDIHGGDSTFPVVGDVTGDGRPEVVVVAKQRDQRAAVHVIDPRTPGLVRRWTAASTAGYLTAPALADVDGNGVLDVVVQTDGALDVHTGGGVALPGFPVTVGGGRAGLEVLQGSAPAVGDLDGDGRQEIAVTSTVQSPYDVSVYVYRSDGTLHPRFPKRLGGGTDTAPAIADLDADGRNELVVVHSPVADNRAGLHPGVWVWDLGGGPAAPPQWGQHRGGPRHEGIPSGRTAPPSPPASTAGTGPVRRVADIAAGSSEPLDLTPFAGGLAFTARHPSYGRELWWTDGTTTRLLADLRPGAVSSGARDLTVVGSALYVVADDGVSGAEPWRVTSTGAASLVRDIRPGPLGSKGSELTAVGTTLYLAAHDGTSAHELWRSDGTSAGTALVADLNPGAFSSSPRGLSEAGGVLHFAAHGPAGPDSFATTWHTLRPGGAPVPGPYVSGQGAPVPLAVDGDRFATVDRVGSPTADCEADPFGPALLNQVLRVGPRAVAAGITNLFVGCDPLLEYTFGPSRQVEHLATDGTSAWFTAYEPGAGRELWRSDLSSAGTRLLADVAPGAASSHPSDLVLRGADLLLTADAGGRGREPWLVDRTTGASRLVQDIASGAAGSEPRAFTATSAGVFFTADDGVAGRELHLLPAGATAPTAPSPPTGVSATAGDASATVSWTAAADGGSPVTGYTVTSSPGGKTATVGGSARSAVVSGLTNHTAYTFTVTATNAVGTSAPSAPSAGVTPRPPSTAPSAPTEVTATAGDASAAVTWRAPFDGGSAITGYTVTSSPGGRTASVSGAARTATVEGLTNGTAYTFTVAATNAVGTSPPSAASNSVIPVAPTPVGLSVGDVVVPEGDAGSVVVSVPVRLSAPSTRTVSVAYATHAGSAGAADFRAASGTVEFAPGVTSRSVSLVISPDSSDEQTETFSMALTSPLGAVLADGSATVTILDNDPAPQLRMSDVRVWEGNTGTATAAFTVRLSAPATGDVTLDYATAGSTATSGTDFTAKTGRLTFLPGQVSKTVAIPVQADTIDEAHETFSMTLSGLTGPAALADARGLATVLDDDPTGTSSTPNLRIGDLTLAEGNSGSSTGTMTVRLSAASASAVSATYTLTAGTAGTADFTATSGTVHLPAGATSATIPVSVRGDALDEPTESFTVTLSSPVAATLGDATGTVSIPDDDGAPRLAISDVAVNEGQAGSGSAAFTIRLSAPVAADVTVTYGTANGTATAGSDYTVKTGTVTFSPGQVSRTVTIPTAGDTTAESNETFTVQLTNPTGATISDTTGTATLRNDD